MTMYSPNTNFGTAFGGRNLESPSASMLADKGALTMSQAIQSVFGPYPVNKNLTPGDIEAHGLDSHDIITQYVQSGKALALPSQYVTAEILNAPGVAIRLQVLAPLFLTNDYFFKTSHEEYNLAFYGEIAPAGPARSLKYNISERTFQMPEKVLQSNWHVHIEGDPSIGRDRITKELQALGASAALTIAHEIDEAIATYPWLNLIHSMSEAGERVLDYTRLLAARSRTFGLINRDPQGWYNAVLELASNIQGSRYVIVTEKTRLAIHNIITEGQLLQFQRQDVNSETGRLAVALVKTGQRSVGTIPTATGGLDIIELGKLWHTRSISVPPRLITEVCSAQVFCTPGGISDKWGRTAHKNQNIEIYTFNADSDEFVELDYGENIANTFMFDPRTGKPSIWYTGYAKDLNTNNTPRPITSGPGGYRLHNYNNTYPDEGVGNTAAAIQFRDVFGFVNYNPVTQRWFVPSLIGGFPARTLPASYYVSMAKCALSEDTNMYRSFGDNIRAFYANLPLEGGTIAIPTNRGANDPAVFPQVVRTPESLVAISNLPRNTSWNEAYAAAGQIREQAIGLLRIIARIAPTSRLLRSPTGIELDQNERLERIIEAAVPTGEEIQEGGSLLFVAGKLTSGGKKFTELGVPYTETHRADKSYVPLKFDAVKNKMIAVKLGATATITGPSRPRPSLLSRVLTPSGRSVSDAMDIDEPMAMDARVRAGFAEVDPDMPDARRSPHMNSVLFINTLLTDLDDNNATGPEKVIALAIMLLPNNLRAHQQLARAGCFTMRLKYWRTNERLMMSSTVLMAPNAMVYALNTADVTLGREANGKTTLRSVFFGRTIPLNEQGFGVLPHTKHEEIVSGHGSSIIHSANDFYTANEADAANILVTAVPVTETRDNWPQSMTNDFGGSLNRIARTLGDAPYHKQSAGSFVSYVLGTDAINELNIKTRMNIDFHRNAIRETIGDRGVVRPWDVYHERLGDPIVGTGGKGSLPGNSWGAYKVYNGDNSTFERTPLVTPAYRK